MSEEKPGYFAVIPASVRYDNELQPSAKLLYGEITALCDKEGYCWSKNKYFSELYDVSKRTIKNWISKLIERGHIYKIINQEEGNKRLLFVSLSEAKKYRDKLEKQGVKKISLGGENIFTRGGKKIHHPEKEQSTDNKESNGGKNSPNNTSNDTLEQDDDNARTQEEFSQKRQLYDAYKDMMTVNIIGSKGKGHVDEIMKYIEKGVDFDRVLELMKESKLADQSIMKHLIACLKNELKEGNGNGKSREDHGGCSGNGEGEKDFTEGAPEGFFE